jgi:hypothetical protein
MRKLKRWWQHAFGEYRIRHRRYEIARILRGNLSLGKDPLLIGTGNRGHDSIYFVHYDKKILGVLRLINPYRLRAAPATNMPFILLPALDRIPYEAAIYRIASEHGLAPKVLWQAEDALLCTYFPLTSLQQQLVNQPARAWEILKIALLKLSELHALGVTHMDASLSNMLADNSMSQVVLVDFEYAPKAELSIEQQQIYDYLRLLESSLKYIPDALRSEGGAWFDTLQLCLRPAHARVDLRPLLPALQRIFTVEPIAQKLKSLFLIN